MGRALLDLSWVRSARIARYRARFGGDMVGAFHGVFGSFEEALRAAPRGTPRGFDHAELAEVDYLRSRTDRVHPYDYPVLFWLRPLLQPGVSIFDLGGHVGVHYYGYRGHLDFPSDLRWTVCEVPAVAAAGAALARERSARALRFTNDVVDARGCDVFMAAGVLQYLDGPPLAEVLAGLDERPLHVLLNKLPLTDAEPFVTLQNTGPTVAPQHVFNRERFVASITAIGYELVDAWEDHVHRCEIPFHPERTVRCYSGLYFRAPPARMPREVRGRARAPVRAAGPAIGDRVPARVAFPPSP